MAEKYGNLNELRMEIINKLMTNQDLLKFLFYTDDVDIPSQQNITREQRKNIKDKQIIEHFRVDIAKEKEQLCYIAMDFMKIQRNPEGRFMKPNFSFVVICPESILETQNGSRILCIEQCIIDTFNNSYSLGNIGSQTIVYSSDNVTGISSPYQARKIDITMVDYVELKK